jgi:hypothetical protein
VAEPIPTSAHVVPVQLSTKTDRLEPVPWLQVTSGAFPRRTSDTSPANGDVSTRPSPPNPSHVAPFQRRTKMRILSSIADSPQATTGRPSAPIARTALLMKLSHVSRDHPSLLLTPPGPPSPAVVGLAGTGGPTAAHAVPFHFTT